MTEAEHHGIDSFDELNDRFMAWAEQIANLRTHSETDQRPLDRFLAGPLRMPDLALLAEAFRWSVTRAVTKTATVSLLGNRYQVDASLIGYRVELRYDPEDLSRLDVYLEGDLVGVAAPLVIGRHVHPKVPQAEPPQVIPTGVDYLGLVLANHEETLGSPISYRDVSLFGDDDGDGLVGARP